ncbi:hypothetical protein [Rubinisphaera margarita]|uniref:hypothetical protein n=1 Tax=Rubinisphaera margarita TaxID=2909586 RepID=UPI001EE96169|nr:hypothetical protein [Rubinisphaera margarita]MCG6157344.1 hypothetical protein [Rubinisphaera margarita]
MQSIFTFPRGIIFNTFLLAIVVFTLTGCGDSEQIRTYETRKPEDVFAENHIEGAKPPERTAPPMMSAPSTEAVGEPARMFGAMVRVDDQTWFYKLTGPVDEVNKIVPQLRDYVVSMKYENGQPVLTKPEGWEQLPGNQFRFATMKIPAESGALEMSISPLPSSEEELLNAVANINRWRGQLGLGEIKSTDIEAAGDDPSLEISKASQDGRTIYFVNIVGEQKSTGMRPPFAG